jgi:putative spermidine/putrescine transport system ATP-binding protein
VVDAERGRPRAISAVVRLEGLRKSYGGHAAVTNLTLEIGAGEFLTLLGPSGSGKTTTLMMIAGFVTPDGGDIRIGGRSVVRVPPEQREIGMVFQNYALFPHMTVADNIAFPLKMRSRPQAEIAERVANALAVVKLQGFERRLPRELSGGQQQRVALARAVVFEPLILLMDEPLGALDKRLRQHMQGEIKRIQRELAITVIYVTHDQEEALTMSDRIALMHEGRVAQLGTPAQLYNEPRSIFVADFIGESNFLNGAIIAASPGNLVEIETAGGAVFRATARKPLRLGDKVTAAVRPEHLTILRESADLGANHWRGKVVEVIYVGDTTKYRVTVGSEPLNVSEQNRDRSQRWRVGETVSVSWSPSHTTVLDDVGTTWMQATLLHSEC